VSSKVISSIVEVNATESQNTAAIQNTTISSSKYPMDQTSFITTGPTFSTENNNNIPISQNTIDEMSTRKVDRNFISVSSSTQDEGQDSQKTFLSSPTNTHIKATSSLYFNSTENIDQDEDKVTSTHATMGNTSTVSVQSNFDDILLITTTADITESHVTSNSKETVTSESSIRESVTKQSYETLDKKTTNMIETDVATEIKSTVDSASSGKEVQTTESSMSNEKRIITTSNQIDTTRSGYTTGKTQNAQYASPETNPSMIDSKSTDNTLTSSHKSDTTTFPVAVDSENWVPTSTEKQVNNETESGSDGTPNDSGVSTESTESVQEYPSTKVSHSSQEVEMKGVSDGSTNAVTPTLKENQSITLYTTSEMDSSTVHDSSSSDAVTPVQKETQKLTLHSTTVIDSSSTVQSTVQPQIGTNASNPGEFIQNSTETDVTEKVTAPPMETSYNIQDDGDVDLSTSDSYQQHEFNKSSIQDVELFTEGTQPSPANITKNRTPKPRWRRATRVPKIVKNSIINGYSRYNIFNLCVLLIKSKYYSDNRLSSL